MKAKISEMKTLLEGILAKHGLSKKDAEIIAEDYLLGEKEGKKSHGLMAFPPMIEKIGTLKRAWGEVRVAKAEKRNLPENTFMDADGNFTTKPEKAESVAPFGDYKGYAIALLVEIL